MHDKCPKSPSTLYRVDILVTKVFGHDIQIHPSPASRPDVRNPPAIKESITFFARCLRLLGASVVMVFATIVIQHILGHTQVKTTQRYADLSQDTLLAASNVATLAFGSVMGAMPNRVLDVPLVAA